MPSKEPGLYSEAGDGLMKAAGEERCWNQTWASGRSLWGAMLGDPPVCSLLWRPSEERLSWTLRQQPVVLSPQGAL